MEDHIFSLRYGISGLCVLLTIMVLMRVAEFVWKLYEKKESLSESAVINLSRVVQENTIALQMLDLRLKNIEASISELPKIKNDLRRFFSAVKEIAGERWPEIRDELMKDGFN